MDLSKYLTAAAGSPPSVPSSPSAGYPTAGNPATGTPATAPGPYWYYQVQAEMSALLSAGGVTPDQAALNQVAAAVAAMILAARPAGQIIWTATTAPVAGTLLADGGLVSRSAYPRLFQALCVDPGFTSQPFTVSVASPCVVTKTAHGLSGLERLRLSTTGALPTGLNTSTDYFVVVIDANTFWLSSSYDGATLINTSGTQSGSHSYLRSAWGLGDGSTTFAKPNLVGQFTRGSQSGRDVGTWQRGSLAGVDINGLGVWTPASSHTGATALADIGADAIAPAAYPSAVSITAANGATSYALSSTTEFVAGASRPANIGLLPCVVY